MSAEQEIRRRIGLHGSVTFAEFMEVALFWPDGGYYFAGEPIGAGGDYYTSPHVHPAFGALLAVQLFQMWQLLGRPHSFVVVEMGAGSGLLAKDVSAAAAGLPASFSKSLRYICVDLRAIHGLETTSDAGSRGYRIASTGLPFKGLCGCIISNEYLDAFPVHQVVMGPDGLQEIYVTQDGDDLATCPGPVSTPALAARLAGLGVELKAGQTAEVALTLDTWVAEAARSLKAGFVLTVDYGHPAAELYSAERRYRGTLTTFYRHTQLDAPLRHVGSQDITAQVDFSTVVDAGKHCGLEPLVFTTQSQFLNNLGISRLQQRMRRLGLSQRQTQANLAGMVDLARPEGLGGFKVLIQGKGAGVPKLWGFQPSEEAAELVEQLIVPLLTPEHLSLVGGRLPSAEDQFQVEWPFEDWPDCE